MDGDSPTSGSAADPRSVGAVAVSGLGGTESFTLGIVTRILAVNTVAFVGLYGLHRLGGVIGLSGSRVAIRASVARPASL